VAALADLLAADHTFIDSQGRSVTGRAEMIEAWKAYFAMFPDYAIRAEHLQAEDGVVAVFGSASGTYYGKRGLVAANRIAMPAAWKATVADGQVRLWQVYCDWAEGLRIIGEDRASG
jgi:ketosteroid isomerase-like protein